MTTADTTTLSARRQTLRAAAHWAYRSFVEGKADAAREASLDPYGDECPDEARAEYAEALARQPWQASDAWVNAGVDLAPRWRQLFLRELDRQTARIAREYLRSLAD